jgi:hypothetical protein
MPEQTEHAVQVLAWLDTATAGLPPAELVALFEIVLARLWRCASRTLGEVTLVAVADRVVFSSVERFPVLTGLVVGRDGVSFDGMKAHAAEHRVEALRPAMQVVLVELLTLLGKLTGEILTRSMHQELAATRLPGERTDTRRDAGEDRE